MWNLKADINITKESLGLMAANLGQKLKGHTSAVVAAKLSVYAEVCDKLACLRKTC